MTTVNKRHLCLVFPVGMILAHSIPTRISSKSKNHTPITYHISKRGIARKHAVILAHICFVA